MKRNATLCSILIVASGASYMSWNNTEESGGDAITNVPVFQANERDVNMITWESPTQSVVATRRTDAKGDYTWITVTEQPAPQEAPAPDAEVEADVEDSEAAEATEAPPVEEPIVDVPAPEPTVVSFVGNETSNKLWKNLSPLRALRALPQADAINEDVLAFEATATALTLGKESGRITLEVGGETYGSKDRFVRNGEQLYLVDDAMFRPLLSPNSQLVEHRLFPVQEADAERVDIRRARQTVGYAQQNKDDRAQSFWSEVSDPDTENQGAGLWIGKLFRLRVKRYVGQPVEGAQPLFAFTVHDQAERWDVEILRHTADGQDTYYARSSLTRGVVELTRSLTADIAEDLDSVLE